MTEARRASRPLRALVIVFFLWSGGRATYELAPLIGAARQSSSVSARPVPPDYLPEPSVRDLPTTPVRIRLPGPKAAFRPQRIAAVLKPSPVPRVVAYPLSMRSAPGAVTPMSDGEVAPAVPAKVDPQSRSAALPRWSMSSWLLVRDGSGSLTPTGTLGGTQVGVRAYFSLTPALAATARISTPLRATGTEASIGAALRQGPVTLLLERRIALERGGRNDFSAMLAAGIDRVRLPQRFHLDAYGQAGIVGGDGFADGAVRIERRIALHDKTEIALGAGLWGGAQPGVARLDVGPQIVIRTPLAGGNLRASGEWRQRIAGNAQPASGPALTLGMDF